MPGFRKPDFPYDFDPQEEITALRDYESDKEGRAIPPRTGERYRIAGWNIANLGVQERRDQDHDILAEMISWFDLVAVQEVNDNLHGLREIQGRLPGYRVLFSDKGGNNERMAFIYDAARVELLEKVGEVAVPPRWKYVIKVPNSEQKFKGFDRNPYLAAFRLADLNTVLVNVHLYYGSGSTRDKNRRFMETLATARWADLRRRSDNAFTGNIMIMGDFNLEKVGWEDPMWRVLGEKGLHLVPHSSYVGGTNTNNDRPYDQIAFFPGAMGRRVEASGVFDFDGALFASLWNDTNRDDRDFNAYMRYYISDHRILWATINVGN